MTDSAFTDDPKSMTRRAAIRRWAFAVLSLLSVLIGLLVMLQGTVATFILGAGCLTVVGFAANATKLWRRPTELTSRQKVLVWVAAAPAAAVLAYLTIVAVIMVVLVVAALWLTVFLIRLYGPEWMRAFVPETQFGRRGYLRVRQSFRANALQRRTMSDFDRILTARYVGDEEVQNDGGVVSIGGRVVSKQAGLYYIGDRPVDASRITRDGGVLYLDGNRVQE